MNKPTEQQVHDFNIRVKSRGLRGDQLITYKEKLTLTLVQKDIIIGTLLGDASIRASKAANYNIKFEQKYTQLEYLKHLYKVFEPYVGTGPRMRVIRNSFHKDYGVSCWFRTYSHIHFKYYENRFYKIDEKGKRRKIVPKNIHQMLTPRALAYWFMDDGSSRGLCYQINTQGFTQSEQKILIKALKRNFGLNFDQIKDRSYYRLQLPQRERLVFEKLIRPYIRPTFEYKLKLTKSARQKK